jgi:hypothetical protein
MRLGKKTRFLSQINAGYFGDILGVENENVLQVNVSLFSCSSGMSGTKIP